MISINKALIRKRPNVELSRKLLGQVHKAFGGQLLAMFTGGAFIDPQTLQFFYELGIPVEDLRRWEDEQLAEQGLTRSDPETPAA